MLFTILDLAIIGVAVWIVCAWLWRDVARWLRELIR